MSNTTFILISIAIFLFPYIGKIWFGKNTLSSAVVSLGLFSTFCGIVWCLYDLDVNDINFDIALPQLLTNVKITFYTSIAGMITSIILKTFPAFYRIKISSADTSSSFQDNRLLELLSSIDKKIGNGNTVSLETESLNTLFKELSDKFIDAQKEQIIQTEQLNHINQKLSESIQAIGSIIEKFNTKETTHPAHEVIDKRHASLETDIINLNASCKNLDLMINNTKDILQQQMNDVEEKFATKLDSMQEFSQTLLAIVKKLSQDHNTLHKQQNLNQEPEK